MKIAFTMPTAGAGRWAWQGWVNAFNFFGHRVYDTRLISDIEELNPDLLICTTSDPRPDFIEWRRRHPENRVALNVLAYTNEDLPGINNVGVQATQGNVEYAYDMRADVVFAQFSEPYRRLLLGKWEDLGFRLSGMEMAADAVVYPYPDFTQGVESIRNPDIFYVGGRWAYKAQNLDRYLLPILKESESRTVVGRGWPFPTTDMSEHNVGLQMKHAKVVPNIHEPHSTHGGYDVVERVFKTLYCGGLCISDSVREISEGFDLHDGEHLIMCESPDEYRHMIADAIKNNEDYDLMRERGHNKVARFHTYFNRAALLLLDLEMLEEFEAASAKLHKWHRDMGIR